MVENQHSINNILSFGAKSVNPVILEKLLVGREDAIKYLYESVESIAKNNDTQYILVIGQRGMGKTHLIRVLYSRIQKFIETEKLEVAYFSEEEYGIADYFDFLMRVIIALKKWNEKDEAFFDQKIIELQELSQGNRENLAEKIIEEYIGKKPLLILTENFADILESIKPKEQSKLRAWLSRIKKISIIATSQNISDDFDSEERPFYEWFNSYYLKKLTYYDTLDFLRKLAVLENQQNVIDYLDDKKNGEIKALHRLVKGNHRLLVTFYQFLKTNTLASLSENFIKTINDLKPYYETHIRYLPPQQQKVLRFIALQRKPQQGVDISKNCFIDQKSLTKQLSELTRKKLVEAIVNPNDKRNKLYEVSEPLLRISIEVGEHREGITAIFIDFLAIYYNEEELSTKKEGFLDIMKSCASTYEQTALKFEVMAIDKALDLKRTEYLHLEPNLFKVIDTYLEKNGENGLFDYLIEKEKIRTKEEYFFRLSEYYFYVKAYPKSITNLEKVIGVNPRNSSAFTNLGLVYSILAKKEKNEDYFNKTFEVLNHAIEINPNSDSAYINLGNAQSTIAVFKNNYGLFNQSSQSFEKALLINPNNEDAYYNWGCNLLDFAKLRNEERYFKEANQKFKKAIEFQPDDIQSYNNWGTSLFELGKITNDLDFYEEAVEKYEKSIDIDSKNGIAYLNYGRVLSMYAAQSGKTTLFENSFNSFNNASSLIPNEDVVYRYWALAILMLSEVKQDASYFNEIKEKINKAIRLNPEEDENLELFHTAIVIINKITPIPIKAIKFISLIKSLIVIKKSYLLNNWIILALKISKDINKEQLDYLSKTATDYQKEHPELIITANYIDIYKRYILDGDKKAIYDLPKEQRLFFEENILNKLV